MTVTTTTFTTPGNSRKIAISNEIGNRSTNVISAVDSAILALGWSTWDTIATTTYNPIATYVYRVLNADGVTYKYFILRWDTVKLMFYTSTCEYWHNNFLHQPVNETWSNGGAFAQGYDLANSFIIVAGTARNLMLWNNINNQAGLWTGVFEFERVAAEDRAVALQPAGSNSYSPVISGSLYFNGSSYLSTTSSAAATGDFTVECWIYPTVATQCSFLCIGNESSGRIVFFTSAGILTINQFGGSSYSLASGIAINTWQHVAVVRRGTVVTGYVNGVPGGTNQLPSPGGPVTISGTVGNTSGYWVMGLSTPAAQGTGYVTNVRYVNGTALYTAGFNPPFGQLTPVTNTALLLNMGPTAPFTDAGTSALTVTNTGSIPVTAPNPFLTTFSFGNLYTNTSTNTSVYTTGFVANTSAPCYAYTNSVMLGTPFGVANSAARSSPQILAFPRTYDGNVYLGATANYTTVTNRGPMPPAAAYGNLIQTTDTNQLHLGSYQTNSNATANTYATFGTQAGGSMAVTTGSWLSIGPGTAFNVAVASNPFTVEGWVYMAGPGGALCGGISPGTGVVPISLSFNTQAVAVTAPDAAGYYPHFSSYNGTAWSGLVSPVPVQPNTWTHVAGVFTGSTSLIFLNGIQVAAGGITSWLATASQGIYIGRGGAATGAASQSLTGLISQFRYVRGTAVYTSNFTPPQTTLTAVANTNILLTTSNSAYYLTDTSGNVTVNTVFNSNGSPVTFSNLAPPVLGWNGDTVPYRWDLTKTPVSTISADVGTTTANTGSLTFGRMYGMGIGRPVGNVRVPDTTLANIDSTNGWPSVNSAQTTEAILLPLNGGVEPNTSYYSASTFSNVFANIGSSMIPAKAVAVGDTLFVAANAGVGGAGQGGIFTISQATGQGATPTFRSNISFGVFDILFDGNGWIWGSTSNGIVRMDTQTFTTTFYTTAATVANGVGYLGIDNKNIYCTSRVASTKPQTYVFDRTQNAFNGTIDTTTAFTAASTWGTPVPDYSGNIYSFQTPGITTATSLYMQLNSNTAVYSTINSTTNPGGAAINFGHTAYYDYITQRLWEIVPSFTAGAVNVAELFPGNLTTRGTVTGIATQNTTAATYQGSLTPTATVDNRGDLYVVPMRGHLSIGTKRPGAVTQALTGFYSFADPISWNSNNANPGNFGNVVSGFGVTSVQFAPLGFSGWTTTNTVQMFAPWGTGTAPTNDNRLYTINGLFTGNTTTGANVGRIIMRG